MAHIIPYQNSQIDNAIEAGLALYSVDGLCVADGEGGVSAAVSGTDVKTVNNQSIIGSGNIAISNGVITASNVSVSSWLTDSTYSGYSYKCEIAIANCTADHVPMITLSVDDATSGNYAPVALTSLGKVTIYSKTNTAITIPSIQLTKAV